MRALSHGTISFAILFCLLTVACNKILFRGPSAEDLAGGSELNWRLEESAHFQTYLEIGSYGDRQAEKLIAANERAYEHVLGLLGLESYPDTISVFVIESRVRMAELIGWETNGSAFPQRNVICYVFSETIQAHGAHELAHVISINAWGESENWLKEGLAVYADDSWYGFELHQLAAHLLQTERLPTLPDLVSDFSSHNDMISYPATGSFVKYLAERYGIAAVKEIWQRGHKAIPTTLGSNLESVEASWRELLGLQDTNGIVYPTR